MATAVLTPQSVGIAGAELFSDTAKYTAATAADGFEFVNDGNTLVHIKNTDSGACTLTIDCPQPCEWGGTTIHDETASVTNAEDWISGKFPVSRFNEQSTGKVTIRLTASADVTKILARAIKLT
jgi:hypothetical protein